MITSKMRTFAFAAVIAAGALHLSTADAAAANSSSCEDRAYEIAVDYCRGIGGNLSDYTYDCQGVAEPTRVSPVCW